MSFALFYRLSYPKFKIRLKIKTMMFHRLVNFLFYFFFFERRRKKSTDFYQVHYLYVANLFGCDFFDNGLDNLYDMKVDCKPKKDL